MLQIRLSNKATASESGGGPKLPSGETVTVACPDHLVLAELPVAKTLGSANGVTLVQTVGRRSRRPLGEHVHFCVQCDFPIAIYGRLIPCEHAFCLDCARSDSICYLCEDRIQKIQTIKMMEGIFICAAPHCLKSFLKKPDFMAHIHSVHANLLNSNPPKNENEPETTTTKKPTTSESTVQAPTPRPHIQPKPNPQQTDNRGPVHGFDGPTTPMMHHQQQNFEATAGGGQYPMTASALQLPPNFVNNPNVMGPTSLGQQIYVGGQGGSESAAGGVEQGSLLGYPQPWNGGAPFDPSSMMMNQRGGFFQGNGNDGRGGVPPPPFAQMPGNFFGGGGDLSHHGGGQGYGWQQDKRDTGGFGNGQD